jgi:hypothetical protein
MATTTTRYFAPLVASVYRGRPFHAYSLSLLDVQETFDVAQEHVQLLYRQFLIVLGSFVFPLITIFAVAANLLEYDSFYLSVVASAHVLSRFCGEQDILGQGAVGVPVQTSFACRTPHPHEIHRLLLHSHLFVEPVDVP